MNKKNTSFAELNKAAEYFPKAMGVKLSFK